MRHKLRIIGHISKKNQNNFRAVQNGRKLSTIASYLKTVGSGAAGAA